MSKECIQVKATDIIELLYDVYGVPSGICEQIKNMVQRLESIDNAKPSEALECLERLNYHTTLEYQDSKEYYIARQYIHKAQENEKTLSIIKEKDVDIYILKNCKTVDEYNSKIVHIVGETRELTKEEFDLVKGMLG